MKLSVIMPSLNVDKYIKKCLQSVVNQTLQDIEIICVDAGSTDGTLDVIKEFAENDSRIKIINSDVKSYGYQMNLGLKAASGEYIGIVETDDFIDEDMLEELYSYVVNNKVDFVKSLYYEYVNKNGCEQNIPLVKKNIAAVSGKIICLNDKFEYKLADTMHIWSGIYRRDFLLNNDLFFNETPGASFQDISFSILTGLMADTCIYVDKCFYHYRIDNENSSVKSDSKITCVIDEYKYIMKYLENKKMLNNEIEKTLNTMKLGTYNWNYMRLSDESRCKFINAISDEMKLYNYDELDDLNKEIYSNLTDKSRILLINKRIAEKSDWNRNLIEMLKSNEKFNIVGAGNKFKTLIYIQKFLNKKFIDVVCDNSEKIQGNIISGYKVYSVEEVLNLNNNKWFIASKYFSDEIKVQLTSLGVQKNNIISLKEMYPFDELINYNLI